MTAKQKTEALKAHELAHAILRELKKQLRAETAALFEINIVVFDNPKWAPGVDISYNNERIWSAFIDEKTGKPGMVWVQSHNPPETRADFNNIKELVTRIREDE